MTTVRNVWLVFLTCVSVSQPATRMTPASAQPRASQPGKQVDRLLSREALPKLRAMLLMKNLLRWKGTAFLSAAAIFCQAAEPIPPVPTPDFTNRLAHEKSPYLLQHQHNPVDWYPWG